MTKIIGDFSRIRGLTYFIALIHHCPKKDLSDFLKMELQTESIMFNPIPSTKGFKTMLDINSLV